jgi:L-seryl-tRNA(Ser) seleniumtransferase
VAQSGAELVEVGSTNRTRTDDYARAIGPATAGVLRVHQSNFRMSGFVQRPTLRELVGLGVPVIDDLGSGALDPGRPVLGDEPDVRGSIAAGAALACFSGDKLLGGPQAGIIVGATDPVGACRAHPLARALRIDKLCLAGLEATLELHLDPATAGRIPVLEMLELAPEVLTARTAELARLTGGSITEMPAAAGGGALPLRELRGPAVALEPGPDGAEAFAAALRGGHPALVARIQDDRVLLSARTLAEEEIAIAARCVEGARRLAPGT